MKVSGFTFIRNQILTFHNGVPFSTKLLNPFGTLAMTERIQTIYPNQS